MLPNAVVLILPPQVDTLKLAENELKDEIQRLTHFQDTGRPLVVIENTSSNVIEIFKIMEKAVFVSRFFVDGKTTRRIHSDERVASNVLSERGLLPGGVAQLVECNPDQPCGPG